MSNRFVENHILDRQWDLRVNVPTSQDLDRLLTAIQAERDAGKFRYALVGGIEKGDKPYFDDYEIDHVHVALIYINRVSKASILKNLNIKTGLGYYLVPRNRSLPYAGWRKHHTKKETKLDATKTVLFEYGTLPEDTGVTEVVKRNEIEKKRKQDDIILEMTEDIKNGREEESYRKFPRNFLIYGEKIKALVYQKKDFEKSNGDPHIWLYGKPGTGKSAILNYIYPKYYNKNLDNKFYDLYNPKHHTHMLLQDVDHNVVEKLGVQFLKTICDEQGFPVDQKYKACQLTRTTVLVSSNFTLENVMPEDMKERNINLQALTRRFWIINIKDLLPALGIKLLTQYELKQLKLEGNQDPSRLFLSYDYLRDCPTGEQLPPPDTLQAKIRELYYGKSKEQ
uniref:Replication protein n=1 Tax=Phoenicopteridae parvo-like hybrid virus TaxID=2794528 RepID=A0A8A4XCE6_9VIRU|nr:MAG: replication protein [Phoenicopteridae parvo-like hybrid virus]